MNSSVPDKKKVTIVLYVCKGKKNTQLAIKNCLNQTYKKIELIIVRDGVDERAESIISSFNDPRMKVIRHDQPKLLGAALKEAFDQATGQYFTWMKDADILDLNAIDEMAGFLDKNPGIEFVYADYRQLDPETNVETPHPMPDVLDFSMEEVVGPCFLYTKKVVKKIGDYNGNYEMAADIDYWIRVVDQFRMVHYPEALSTQRGISYYGERIDRIYSFLFQRYVRFISKFATRENFETGVKHFIERIEEYNDKKEERIRILKAGVAKVYRISFKFGLFFQYVLLSLMAKSYCTAQVIFLREIWKKIKFYVLALRFKKKESGINVLVVIPEAVLGGSEKVVLDIVSGLTPQGFNFHLFAAKGEESSWVKDFLLHFQNIVFIKKGFNPWLMAYDDECYDNLAFMVRNLDIKIMLINHAHSSYQCLQKLKTTFPDLQVVDLLHVVNYCGTHADLISFSPLLERRVCISHGLKNYMADMYKSGGIDPKHMEKMTVIHNGNDMNEYKREKSLEGNFKQRYHISPDTKIISYIGRFSVEKRPVLFVDIAKKIVQDNPNEKLKFVMAGDGIYLKAVQERIRSLNMEDQFLLTGVLNKEQVKELMVDTYLVFIVSFIEGLPLVAVEAMSLGVPVICTDVGAIKEAIQDGVNGYLVDSQKDVAENFSKITTKLCSFPDLYRSVAEKTRVTIEKDFALDKSVQLYYELFNEMAGGIK